MTVTIDHDKWLAAIANEPDGPCTAVPPEYLADRRVGEQAVLVLTFRTISGASEDERASVTAHLLCRLSWREEELGGGGLEFDLNGSVFGPDRVVLRLFPSKREGAAERVAQLADELNSEGRRVSDRIRHETDGGIGDKIVRDLKSPLPESAMKHLETAAVA